MAQVKLKTNGPSKENQTELQSAKAPLKSQRTFTDDDLGDGPQAKNYKKVRPDIDSGHLSDDKGSKDSKDLDKNNRILPRLDLSNGLISSEDPVCGKQETVDNSTAQSDKVAAAPEVDKIPSVAPLSQVRGDHNSLSLPDGGYPLPSNCASPVGLDNLVHSSQRHLLRKNLKGYSTDIFLGNKSELEFISSDWLRIFSIYCDMSCNNLVEFDSSEGEGAKGKMLYGNPEQANYFVLAEFRQALPGQDKVYLMGK
jgi:hypothetical protein